jgi:nucleotide-binding universal stress UspA family protein
MYQKILVPLQNCPADKIVLAHAAEIALRCGSQILLLHVASGFAMHLFEQLELDEELRAERSYLEKFRNEYLEENANALRKKNLSVETRVALGNPPTEILKIAEAEQCHLIAMTSHGHRLLGDIVHGSTINEVRHHTHIPIFLVRAEKK